jgi:hypothetical protein
MRTSSRATIVLGYVLWLILGLTGFFLSSQYASWMEYTGDPDGNMFASEMGIAVTLVVAFNTVFFALVAKFGFWVGKVGSPVLQILVYVTASVLALFLWPFNGYFWYANLFAIFYFMARLFFSTSFIRVVEP